jgi:hypothetical protein
VFDQILLDTNFSKGAKTRADKHHPLIDDSGNQLSGDALARATWLMSESWMAGRPSLTARCFEPVRLLR